MATRKSGSKKKVAVRKVASKRSASPRPKAAAASSKKAGAPASRNGLITHTELASTDPAATQSWCERVLGWQFAPAMPTPTGPYRMWRFANDTGGGIRANNPPEVPGSIPYCEVANIKTTYAKSLAAGATAMLPPQQLPGGMGSIAIVAAPGGVAIGFWSSK